MLGYDSNGIRDTEIHPRTTMEIVAMVRVTGRPTEKLAIFIGYLLAEWTSLTALQYGVHHGDHNQCQQRRQQQSPDHRDRHGCADLGSLAHAHRHRQ